MDTWRVPHVAEPDDAARVDLNRWPLVGRDDELELATSALEACNCVVLTGAAGVGKTRLAHEVLARVATDDNRTEWVAATQSAATVPLGAVAHLVPDAAIGRGRDATLRGIVAALRRDDGERLLLAIDDAHLLDDASAALVQLLVAGGTASAVVTVRSGERAPGLDCIVVEGRSGPARRITSARTRRSRDRRHDRARRSDRRRDAALPVGVEPRQRPVPARARPSRRRVGHARDVRRAYGVGEGGSSRANGCTISSRCAWAR